MVRMRLALPRIAPSVDAVANDRDCYVAAVARYITIQSASRVSNALQNGRDHKSAAPAQADERDAATEDGRSYGGGSDGAVPDGRGGITCELACPSPRPSHVCSPLTFPCDGAGALRSSQPSLLVVLAPLWSSGAAGRPAQTSGANGRCVLLCGRRAGPSLCSLVMAPRSRCVAFLGLWCMVHGAEDCCKRP